MAKKSKVVDVSDPLIRSRFSVRDRCVARTGSRVLVNQHFKDECDINSIVARYRRTGILGDPLAIRQGTFCDVSGVQEFSEAMQRISAVKESFLSLPALVRARFRNSPEALLEFLDDSSNYEEAVKLGLLVEREPVSGSVAPDGSSSGDDGEAVDGPALAP